MAKAQRNWLIVLFSGPVLLLLIYLGLIILAKSSLSNMSGQELGRVSVAMLLILLLSLIPAAILYHCSYKKKGTALLTWSIWLGSIGLGISLIKEVVGLVAFVTTGPHDFNRSHWLSVFLIYGGLVLLSHGINAAWIITCINLKKFNLRWTRERLEKNAVYRAIFEELREITQVKDLHSHYASSVRKHPEIEKFLKLEYKKRKKALV